MAKKDISKTLSSGSIEQRLLLTFEDKARLVYGKKTLLSKREATSISNSFKTAKELKVWNEWLTYSQTVTFAITNLQGALFEVKRNYSNLRGYILTWNAIEHAELLANSILHEIKDPKKRIEIANKGSYGIDLLFSKTTIDKEGYLDLKTEFPKDKNEPDKIDELSLKSLIDNVKEQTTTSIIKFISWKKAILDYMEEKNFNVETYREVMQVLFEEIGEPVIGWRKYLSNQSTFLPLSKNKALDRLKHNYSVTPIIKDLKVDLDIYHYFKNEFL